MALRIQRREWKHVTTWRLIIEDYSVEPRRITYPERRHYPRYGFDPDESYESALKKLETIRARNKLERMAERRALIDKRIRKEEMKESAYLPRSIYEQFLDWLKDRRVWDEIPEKTKSHLLCMRKLVLEVNVDPTDLSASPQKVYRWFLKEKLSLSYLEKVLPLLNAYCFYYCKEFKRPFLEIPAPPGDIARRIDEANRDERDGDGGESLPITPAHIEKLGDMPEEQLRWLRMTIYFGLRPSEVDELTAGKRGKVWDVKKDPTGKLPVLHFYQRKLVRLAPERRWKRIPCILPEQVELAKEIQKGETMRRPLVKTLEHHLGDGHYLYGGRKGFEKLMRSHGQADLHVSRWLGHQDIRRTEWNYREKEAVDFTPLPKT